MEKLETIEHNRGEDSEWVQAERFWISTLRFLGCPLLNVSNGGEGSGTYKSEKQIALEEASLFEKKLSKTAFWKVTDRHLKEMFWLGFYPIDALIEKFSWISRRLFYERHKQRFNKAQRTLLRVNAWHYDI